MRTQNRQASILIVLLFLLPVIILVVGFSIDVAHIQRVRTELSTATDLAAKAGADALSQTQSTTQARNAAIQVASENYVGGLPLTLDPQSIVFGRSDVQPDGSWDFTQGGNPTNAIKVIGSRTATSPDGGVPSYFGIFYGYPTYQPEFEAVAALIDVDICLVLDRSSSMKLDVTDTATGMSSSHPNYCLEPQPGSRWLALDSAVNTFLNEINMSNGDEKVGVVSFASDYTSPCGETNQSATINRNLTFVTGQLQSAMNSLRTSVWNGNTDIATGIQTGRQVLTGNQSRPFAQKIMIVFSDGAYTEADPMPQVSAAVSEEITVHTITFSAGANQTDMAAFASAGNGRHYHADTAQQLDEVFRELAASLALLVK